MTESERATEADRMIQWLVDLEAIKALKYRYMRSVDTKDWDLLASTLEPDVSAHYGDRLDFSDRAELVAWFAEHMGDEFVTAHDLHQPEIDIDGDAATGTWSLRDWVIMPNQDIMITGAAFYEDTYRRGADGTWRIATTGYARLFETMETLGVRSDFRLTANRWSQADSGSGSAAKA